MNKGRTKKTVSITLDPEIAAKAQALGINISKVCENTLIQYIKAIEANNFLDQPSFAKEGWCGRRDLNPGRRRGRPQDAKAIDWPAFKKWLLETHRPHVVTSMVSYALQYAECLLSGDLSRVQTLGDGLRPHVVKSLSALSKFLGIHDEWAPMMKTYGLKWRGRNADDIIIDRLTKIRDPEEVYKWILEVKEARPDLDSFMDLIAISGLRFVESWNSYNLIVKLDKEGKLGDYYKEEAMVLEHFQFKDVFIRNSKKAFISWVPPDQVNQIKSESKLTSTDSVQKLIQKKGLKLRFGDVREAHASFMTKFLRPEEIDFLHGRVSANVFMRNYYNPRLVGDLRERALKGVEEILLKVKG